jgi:adenine-specific DNA-methyltransferase
VVYAKDISQTKLGGSELTEGQLSEFKYTADDGRKYRFLGLRQRGSASRREDRPRMYYPIYVNPKTGSISLQKTNKHTEEVFPKKSTGEDGRWMWSTDKELIQTI